MDPTGNKTKLCEQLFTYRKCNNKSTCSICYSAVYLFHKWDNENNKKALPPDFKSGIAQINFNAYQLLCYKLTWHTLFPLVPVDFLKNKEKEKNC